MNRETFFEEFEKKIQQKFDGKFFFSFWIFQQKFRNFEKLEFYPGQLYIHEKMENMLAYIIRKLTFVKINHRESNLHKMYKFS